MRSKKVTLYFPWRYWEALEKHAPEMGYENATQLVTWMPLYSLTVGRPHYATAPIAKAAGSVQDMIIEEIVAAFERGEFKHRSYFEKTIKRVLDKFNLPVPPELMDTLVADAMKPPPKEK
jgi:hypothetical protein